MWPNPQFPADLVTFTEEILNGKLRFLWNVALTVGVEILNQANRLTSPEFFSLIRLNYALLFIIF